MSYTSVRDRLQSLITADAVDTTNGQLGRARQAVINEIGASQWSIITVAKRTPKQRQDFEGYVVIVDFAGSNLTNKLGSKIFTEIENWTIRILSPQVETGLLSLQEDYILDYGDALVQLLIDKPRLQLGDSGLTGVQNVIITGTRRIAPSPYPTGQAMSQHYEFQVTLAIKVQRVQC